MKRYIESVCSFEISVSADVCCLDGIDSCCIRKYLRINGYILINMHMRIADQLRSSPNHNRVSLIVSVLNYNKSEIKINSFIRLPRS